MDHLVDADAADVLTIIQNKTSVTLSRMLTNDQRFVEDLQLDSTDLLDLILEIESRRGIIFPDEYLTEEAIGTVGDMIAVVRMIDSTTSHERQDDRL